MPALLKSDGFFARRRTIHDNDSFFHTLLFWLAGILLSLILCGCHKNSEGQLSHHKAEAAADSVKPKVSIQVNKHYDAKGNVIGVDSTYASYYSNITGDTSRMDSLMRRFDLYFNRDHASFFNREFKPLFFTDSLRYPDFFHDDFFMKRYELNDPYMRGMMHRMDSIKNYFYQELNQREKKSK